MVIYSEYDWLIDTMVKFWHNQSSWEFIFDEFGVMNDGKWMKWAQRKKKHFFPHWRLGLWKWIYVVVGWFSFFLELKFTFEFCFGVCVLCVFCECCCCCWKTSILWDFFCFGKYNLLWKKMNRNRFISFLN